MTLPNGPVESPSPDLVAWVARRQSWFWRTVRRLDQALVRLRTGWDELRAQTSGFDACRRFREAVQYERVSDLQVLLPLMVSFPDGRRIVDEVWSSATHDKMLSNASNLRPIKDSYYALFLSHVSTHALSRCAQDLLNWQHLKVVLPHFPWERVNPQMVLDGFDWTDTQSYPGREDLVAWALPRLPDEALERVRSRCKPGGSPPQLDARLAALAQHAVLEQSLAPSAVLVPSRRRRI